MGGAGLPAQLLFPSPLFAAASSIRMVLSLRTHIPSGNFPRAARLRPCLFQLRPFVFTARSWLHPALTRPPALTELPWFTNVASQQCARA